jgi:hypothetical protein
MDLRAVFCLFETEIHKIKEDSKIKRQTKLDRRGPRPIPIICHFPDPSSFSLPTTFKVYVFKLL